MARFVKISDTDSTCDFINLDSVVKIQCSVKETGGGIKINTVLSENGPQSSEKKKIALITLITVNGSEVVQFPDFEQAKQWALDQLNITVPFDQL